MGISDELAAEIVRRIQGVAAPDRIILFGSAAAGTMNPDSDLDLLILEEEPAISHHESVRLREALGNIGHPVDLFVMPTKRFEEEKSFVGGLAYPAHKHGKVLFAGK